MNAPDKNGMFTCPDCKRKVPRTFRVNEKGVPGHFVCLECQELFYPEYAPDKEVRKITSIISKGYAEEV